MRHIDTDLTSAEVHRFDVILPTNVRSHLYRAGTDFLSSRGIHEPLSWSPPLDDFQATDNYLVPAASWSSARQAVAAAGERMSLDEIAVAYASGATTYELAAAAGVSRQSISRILADGGVSTRRGRRSALDLDIEKIRHLYRVERMTMVQIARIMGCSQGTICRRLRE